jgi:O-antigen/teichoic acid export membrane protein
VSDENKILQIAESSAHGGYYLFIGNTLSTGILVISSIVIARLLGPADYGLYSLAIVVPSLLIGLIDFGITSAITRFSAKFKAENRNSDVERVIKAGLLAELTVGIGASIFCFLFSDSLAASIINRPEASFYIKVISSLILFQTLFNVLSSAFIGLDKMNSNSIMMIFRAVAKILLSPLLIILGFGIFGALLGHILCYLVAVTLGLANLSFVLKRNRGDNGSSSNILKTMLTYGAPIYLSGFLGLFSTQYQTIIIAFFASNIEVGNFQVATLFSTGMALFTYPFTALFPAFSKLENQKEQLNQFFRRSVKYTALIVVPIAVLIAVMSKDFVYTFFGSDYSLAPTFIAFYILLNLYAGFGNVVFGYLFNGIGRTDIVLKSNIISLIVFLPLAPMLTSLYSVTGLIAALFVSGFCSLLYLLLTAVKKIHVSLDLSSSIKIYVASATSATFSLAFLKVSPLNSILNLIFGGLIFCLAYLTLMPIMRIFNATDMEIFTKIFHKIKSLWFILRLVIFYEAKVLKYAEKLTK